MVIQDLKQTISTFIFLQKRNTSCYTESMLNRTHLLLLIIFILLLIENENRNPVTILLPW